MGNLARSGISGGKRVPFEFLASDSPRVLEGGVARCLEACGLLEIAQRVLDHEPLDVTQVAQLLSNASIAGLMKLVNLAAPATEILPLPKPLVHLPLEGWIRKTSPDEARDTAVRFLRAIPFSEIDVVIDWFNYSDLQRLLDLSAELVRRRPGVRFIGPSLEELVEWLESSSGKKAERGLVTSTLDELLFALRRAGFYRLKYATDLDLLDKYNVLERLHDSGLMSVVATPVGGRAGYHEIAQEIVRLRERWSSRELIDVWLPSFERNQDGARIRDAVVDMQLLRVLAVGAICLADVPVKRASSSFLSLEAMSLARSFGANDLGFGAVDETTSEVKKIQSYSVLLQALSV